MQLFQNYYSVLSYAYMSSLVKLLLSVTWPFLSKQPTAVHSTGAVSEPRLSWRPQSEAVQAHVLQIRQQQTN